MPGIKLANWCLETFFPLQLLFLKTGGVWEAGYAQWAKRAQTSYRAKSKERKRLLQLNADLLDNSFPSGLFQMLQGEPGSIGGKGEKGIDGLPGPKVRRAWEKHGMINTSADFHSGNGRMVRLLLTPFSFLNHSAARYSFNFLLLKEETRKRKWRGPKINISEVPFTSVDKKNPLWMNTPLTIFIVEMKCLRVDSIVPHEHYILLNESWHKGNQIYLLDLYSNSMYAT